LLDSNTIRRYRDVISYHAHKAKQRALPGEYALEDVRALALEVAAERHELWDAGAFPPGRDLEIHLQRAIRKDRYARGWKQAKDPETGQRIWVNHGLDDGRLHDRALRKLGDWSGEPYRVLFGDDEGETYSLADGWPAFDPGQRRQFARFMEARYPEVCQAFEALDLEAKPARETWARWKRNRELARGRLHVEFARELAEARFAVTFGLAA